MSALEAEVARLRGLTALLDSSEAFDWHRWLLLAWSADAGLDAVVRSSGAPTSSASFQVDADVAAMDDGDRDIRITVCSAHLHGPAGENGLVARVAYLYLPSAVRGKGHGTTLLRALHTLWAWCDVREITARATKIGSVAFARWGFGLASRGLVAQPKAAVNELRQRAQPATATRPAGSHPVLDEPLELLRGLLWPGERAEIDMQAVASLHCVDGEPYGRRLLSAVEWEAWRPVDAAWRTEPVVL